MTDLLNPEIMERAKKIKLAIFDVDGVLTDGRLIYGDDGQEYKIFNSLDGHGMKMLKASGVLLAFITGRTSRVVELRGRELGIDFVFQGVEDKLKTYLELLAQLNLDMSQTCYMGDDVMDLPILRRCGLAFTVANVPNVITQFAHYVTQQGGGKGAVREVCELIMQAQGTLAKQLEIYLRD